jgi:hypothetical protein
MKKTAFAAVLVIAFAVPLRAQSIGLSPGQITANFKPGVPFELELSVVNYETATIELHTVVTDFWYDDKNAKSFGTPGSSPHSAANWIQFVPENFRVEPSATVKMKAIVTPPADAKGGYYAGLFIESTPSPTNRRTKDGRALYANLRLGCLVLLNAAGTETYDVRIDDLQIRPPTATQELVAAFVVANKSDTHILATPRLAILDKDRKLVAKAQAAEKRFLPGQKDAIDVHWGGTLPTGDYLAVLTLAFGDHLEKREIAFHVP